MANETNVLIARIEWCRRERAQARTQPDFDRWRAEEDGLWDAILDQNRMTQYQCYPTDVFERYAMGLHDGRVMLRVARMTQQVSTQSYELNMASERGKDQSLAAVR